MIQETPGILEATFPRDLHFECIFAMGRKLGLLRISRSKALHTTNYLRFHGTRVDVSIVRLKFAMEAGKRMVVIDGDASLN